MTAIDSKPAVVIVMPLAQQRGGAELSLLALIEHATDVRWHVVFLEEGPMVTTVRRLGIPADVIEAGRVRQPWKMLSAIRAIARLAKANRAAALLGWMAKAHLYSGSAAKLAGIPAVWFQHGLPTRGGVIDELANRIPAIGAMACSQFSADAQLKVTPRLDMKVVYAPTDVAKFNSANLASPECCRQLLKLPSEGPLIGMFGRLQTWKGMHVLIESFPAVLAHHRQATAMIVGGMWEMESDYKEKLHDQVKRLGIEDRVIFSGHQTDIARWMQACDVIVHASNREPFGMVVVEAMALGKPVIAGASGGPCEIITDGASGLLVPFEDSARLSAAILQYLNDPEAAMKMGETARQRAQHFSVEHFAQSVTAAMQNWIYSAQTSKTKPTDAK